MKSPSKNAVKNLGKTPYWFLVLSSIFFLSCSKGFTLKIGDQDIIAFGAQESCNFITANVMSNTLRVSWKSDTPADFIITSSVPAQYDAEIQSAADRWNAVVGKTIIRVHRDNAFPNSAANDRTNAIYWMTTWELESATQQARTAVRWDVSKIVDADIKINAKNFEFYKTGESGTGKVHLESLFVHELGHAVGLTHIADLLSVMQTHLKSQTVRNQPGAIDQTSVKCEY